MGVLLLLSRRLFWRERLTSQRLYTVSPATTASSQPSLTLQSTRAWWAWIPSVDNWPWMSPRLRRPPIRVRSLLFFLPIPSKPEATNQKGRFFISVHKALLWPFVREAGRGACWDACLEPLLHQISHHKPKSDRPKRGRELELWGATAQRPHPGNRNLFTSGYIL